MAFENFLTNEFKVALSLLTISSILLLVVNLTNKKEFKGMKKNLLFIFWSSVIFLIGSISPNTQIGLGFMVIGFFVFILSLVVFAGQLTKIVLKS